MPIIVLAILIILGIIGWASYLIARKAHTGFIKKKLPYALALSAAVFLLCFSLFSFLIFLLIIENISLGR